MRSLAEIITEDLKNCVVDCSDERLKSEQKTQLTPAEYELYQEFAVKCAE